MEVRSFWSGPPLTVFEQLCLRSVVSRGHRVLLYCYDKGLQVPDGVELLDANDIVPGGRGPSFVHADGESSPGAHPDLFRYETLRRVGGWYMDLDVVLLSDVLPTTDVYLASQDDGLVTDAVLRFPAGAPIVQAASQAAGETGPALLTRLVREHRLEQAIRPRSHAFRPMQIVDLFLPGKCEDLARRTSRADFLHLRGEIWRQVRIPKEYGPPEGSFLDRLFWRFGMTFAPEARLSAHAVRSWFATYDLLAQVERNYGGITGLIEANQHVFEERDALLRSSSWRITAPLRAAVHAWRGARHAIAGTASRLQRGRAPVRTAGQTEPQ